MPSFLLSAPLYAPLQISDCWKTWLFQRVISTVLRLYKEFVQYIDASGVLPFTAEKRIFASEYKHSTEDAKNKKIHIAET